MFRYFFIVTFIAITSTQKNCVASNSHTFSIFSENNNSINPEQIMQSSPRQSTCFCHTLKINNNFLRIIEENLEKSDKNLTQLDCELRKKEKFNNQQIKIKECVKKFEEPVINFNNSLSTLHIKKDETPNELILNKKLLKVQRDEVEKKLKKDLATVAGPLWILSLRLSLELSRKTVFLSEDKLERKKSYYARRNSSSQSRWI